MVHDGESFAKLLSGFELYLGLIIIIIINVLYIQFGVFRNLGYCMSH